MRFAVLSIGSELLRGDIVDTNAAFLTHSLNETGFLPSKVEQIPDDLPMLIEAVKQNMESADLIVCTGGLGPTEDDLTRQAIAAALDEDMVEDEALVKELRARFAMFKRPMPRRNLQQALLIPSACSIPNPNGSAPGWYVSKDGRIIVALPGPPSEMQPMWNDWVHSRLRRLLPSRPATRTLMTFGLGESAVEERLKQARDKNPEVVVATYAKSAAVEVHITARSSEPGGANQLADGAERDIRAVLGDAVFGTEKETLAGVTGALLDSRGWVVAAMESCTGGALSSLITDNPGSSKHFKGGIVAYSADVKASFGVDPSVMESHGLISAETAVSMARAARTQLGTDVGLGVTGIAGSEEVEGKPAGTVFVALSTESRDEVRDIHRPGRREDVKRVAAHSALDLLRRHLLETARREA